MIIHSLSLSLSLSLGGGYYKEIIHLFIYLFATCGTEAPSSTKDAVFHRGPRLMYKEFKELLLLIFFYIQK